MTRNREHSSFMNKGKFFFLGNTGFNAVPAWRSKEELSQKRVRVMCWPPPPPPRKTAVQVGCKRSSLGRKKPTLKKQRGPGEEVQAFPRWHMFWKKKKKKRQNKINRPKSRVQGIVPLERFELRTKKWEESAGRFMKLDSDIFGLVSKWDCVTLKLCIWKRRQAAQRLSLEGRCECGDGPVLVSFLFCSGGRLSLT